MHDGVEIRKPHPAYQPGGLIDQLNKGDLWHATKRTPLTVEGRTYTVIPTRLSTKEMLTITQATPENDYSAPAHFSVSYDLREQSLSFGVTTRDKNATPLNSDMYAAELAKEAIKHIHPGEVKVIKNAWDTGASGKPSSIYSQYSEALRACGHTPDTAPDEVKKDVIRTLYPARYALEAGFTEITIPTLSPSASSMLVEFRKAA